MHIYDPTLQFKSRHGLGAFQVRQFVSKLNASGIRPGLHEVALTPDGDPSRTSTTFGKHTVPSMTLEQMMASNGNSCVDILKIGKLLSPRPTALLSRKQPRNS